jgi:hypothetical protein
LILASVKDISSAQKVSAGGTAPPFAVGADCVVADDCMVSAAVHCWLYVVVGGDDCDGDGGGVVLVDTLFCTCWQSELEL